MSNRCHARKEENMVRSSFNSGWVVQPKVSIFSQLSGDPGGRVEVTLPHDAMLAMERSAEANGGASNAYFHGGAVEYSKNFDVPENWRNKRVSVEFQGVYRDAMIYVNGNFAGQRPNGYVSFPVALDPYLNYGEVNSIRVEARAHLDSRWYSGLGIHRDTVLVVTDLAHIAADGIRIVTPDVDAELAVVEVTTTVDNQGISTETYTVSTELIGTDGVVSASDAVPLTIRPGESGVSRHRMYVHEPLLWSVDRPSLYTAVTTLRKGTEQLQDMSTTFGIRTLSLDPVRGLRINGEVVKLRGACIHHDNGLLGAAAIGRAEERRIEILKQAGFNAIRSSHNPISHTMLDACDRLGMLVMDETFDMWTEAKTSFDYSLAFPEWWERDVEAMVAKSFNHPSVIMYSIGNEILDVGKPLGAAWGRRIAAKVRSLDDTRFITNAVSGFVATISEMLPSFQKEMDARKLTGNVNDLMKEVHDLADQISFSDTVTEKTEEAHSVVDVIGHNYADERYLADLERFPRRVVVGTETLSKRIDIIWDLVEKNPHVIGDFTWTGWDYLGEAGLGRTDYYADSEEPPGPDYPWLLAWCGDIDITGHRRPASYYREIVFGLRNEPYIAVVRPHETNKQTFTLNWSWTDSINSWSFDIEGRTPLDVEVYSAAPEVELLLNGQSLGTEPAGSDHHFRAQFSVEYQPGELVAVARYSDGTTTSTVLRSADGPAVLDVRADRQDIRADDSDLAYVEIELRDANGTLMTSQDLKISVNVTGPGVLQALGTARPVTDEPFQSGACTTFEGRALAIVRPTGPGVISVSVASDSLPGQSVTVEALAQDL